MNLLKKCLLDFNNEKTNKLTKKEINNDSELRFTLLDMQKFAKKYHKALINESKPIDGGSIFDKPY